MDDPKGSAPFGTVDSLGRISGLCFPFFGRMDHIGTYTIGTSGLISTPGGLRLGSSHLSRPRTAALDTRTS